MRETAGNLVFSPASIAMALDMTSSGARGGTAEEMRKVLHLEEAPEAVLDASGKLIAAIEPGRPIVFRIANCLFGEKTYTFEPDFLDRAQAAFGAGLEPLDFRNNFEASRAHVNEWVEKETEDRIQDLLPPDSITRDTRLVLVNAIYFLGDWAVPFEKESTRPAPFFVSATDKKDVAMMNRTGSFRFARGEGFSALEIPYKGNDVRGESRGVAAAEGDAQRPWNAARLRPRPGGLHGNRKPTRPAGSPLHRQRLPKAFVKVDEKGTEAAAATAVVMPRMASAPADPIEFKADHPFLFFVRDHASGLVLFMGRVADPSEGGG